MGNTPPMNFSFNAPEIEPIPSWAHQMFRATEQRFNEQAVQMDAARKKQAAQLAETKKNQAALMADFRTLMANAGPPAPAPAPAPVFPVAFPAPAFTSVERREILPKLLHSMESRWNSNHGISKCEPSYRWTAPIYQKEIKKFTSTAG